MKEHTLQSGRSGSHPFLRSLLTILLIGVAQSTHAQTSGSKTIGEHEVYVGSVFEEYLRLLQLSGDEPPEMWAIRSLGTREVNEVLSSVDEHPWDDRFTFVGRDSDPALTIIRPQLDLFHNSEFPFGSNDGAIWAGRGLTVAGRAGIAYTHGPLTVRLAPEAFWAENRGFPIVENGRSGDYRFADPWLNGGLDMPQRFGDNPYGRVALGQSVVRLDAFGATVGLSTENQFWGPAQRHPIILGSNAEGYPHLFLGTSAPVQTRVGDFQLRTEWGRLEHSAYHVPFNGQDIGLAVGLIAAYRPSFLDHLEIGGSRFFHFPWLNDGYFVERAFRPFGGIFKTNTVDPFDEDPERSQDDQLASLFFRWTAPASGFEFYGEYGREDHNWDLRDFLLEPDHTSSYMLGFQKAVVRSPDRLWAIRGELLNAEISHLQKIRLQQPFHIGGTGGAGHTHQGQLLASAYAPGGAAAIFEVDRYDGNGRWRASFARNQRDYHALRTPDIDRDILYTAGVEWLGWRGNFDLTAGATLGYNQNRWYQGNALNLNTVISATYDF